MMDRMLQFLLVVLLMGSLVTLSVPVDYDGVSPQERFALAMDAGFADGATELEEAMNQMLLEMHGVETMEELEALLLEDLDEELAEMIADLEDMSMAQQMEWVQELFAGLFEEMGMELDGLPAVSAERVLGILAEIPVMAEITELLTEEIMLDIMDGWFMQLLIGSIVEAALEDGLTIEELVEEIMSDLASEEFEYSLFAEMDYFFGEGTVEELLALDTNERFELLGELIGGFMAEVMMEHMDDIVEMLGALTAVSTALDLIFIETFEIDEYNLEERFAMDIEALYAMVMLFSEIEGARLNIFLVNTSDYYLDLFVLADGPDPVVVTVAPGASFTVQLTPEEVGEFVHIMAAPGSEAPDDVPFTAYLAFRFTEHPLS
ncbi:MAG: hypothetical protein FWC93_00080 [Defluviitaleaceae bacterium]|nr:hypothetical protein [Defluviitaleaceae bacterium]